MSTEKLLSVRNLSVELATAKGRIRPVDDVSMTLRRGEVVGLVGESGSGKSLTCRALMGLLPGNVTSSVSAKLRVDGKDIDISNAKELARIRGSEIAMIFQNPSSYLDPLMPVWRQIAEPLLTRGRLGRGEARAQAVALMRKVGIPDPSNNARAYPHQLSGGMKQRVMIAAALACKPKVLIADEPTTALDVTVQMQILRLLLDLRKESGLSIILVTHDLAVVSMVCDSVYVMYCGRIMEHGARRDVLGAPAHPYTKALLNSEPSLIGDSKELKAISGQLPSLDNLPSGCRYRTRCEFAVERCANQDPELRAVRREHLAACLRSEELAGDHETIA